MNSEVKEDDAESCKVSSLLTGSIADCTLLHGDCMELLPGFYNVDLVITDPPYMLGSASARKSANKAIGWADINNSSRWYAEWFSLAWASLAKHGAMWVFGNWRTFPVYQCAASKVPGMSVTSVVVWDRQWPGVGSMKGLRQYYELVVLSKVSRFFPCKTRLSYSSEPSRH